MTKTLTKQWREGTLPLGTYYILNINGDEEIDMSVAVGELWNNTDLKEVLAPVPSYDEYKRLVSNSDDSVTKCHQFEKKLAIATKALEKLKNPEKDYVYYIIDKDGNKIDLHSIKVATKALKEIKEVK